MVQQVTCPVKRLPARFFIAERSRGIDPLEIAARLARGTGIILRDYGAEDREAYAHRLATIARRRGLPLLIAGDARLAASLGAAGLHLSRRRLFERPPCRRSGWIVTAAAHDRLALRRAREIGVDAVLVSPVFVTGSHPDAKPLGPHRLARMIDGVELPVYALGGIDAFNARRLPPGLQGLAALSAFGDAEFRGQKLRRVPRYSTPERSGPPFSRPNREL